MASVERIVRAPPDEHEVFRARIELKKVMPVVYFLVAPPSKRERWAVPKWEETLPKALVVEALCGAHREAPSPKALFLMLFGKFSVLSNEPPPDVVYRASKCVRPFLSVFASKCVRPPSLTRIRLTPLYTEGACHCRR
jgi:hypothetical protein